MLKRTFDVIVASFLLLLLSPLLLPVALILRCTGEGEVFYKQERVGRGKSRFYIYKFATMLKISPQLTGGDITIARDPRILPVGRVLRDTKINELPQLLNIIKGDMSVIGWRPLTPRVADLFSDEHWQALADWRPGLSGVGSIVFRDEETLLSGVADRNSVYLSVIAPYKSALEIWYAKNQSFWLDLKLIVGTAIAVVYSKFDISKSLPGLPPPPAALIALRSSSQRLGKN